MRRVVVLPGMGIGLEVTAQAVRIAACLATKRNVPLDNQQPSSGPEAFRTLGITMPDKTFEALAASDTILYGAAGGPEVGALPTDARAAMDLRRLCKALAVFANQRPVVAYP